MRGWGRCEGLVEVSEEVFSTNGANYASPGHHPGFWVPFPLSPEGADHGWAEICGKPLLHPPTNSAHPPLSPSHPAPGMFHRKPEAEGRRKPPKIRLPAPVQATRSQANEANIWFTMIAPVPKNTKAKVPRASAVYRRIRCSSSRPTFIWSGSAPVFILCGPVYYGACSG